MYIKKICLKRVFVKNDPRVMYVQWVPTFFFFLNIATTFKYFRPNDPFGERLQIIVDVNETYHCTYVQFLTLLIVPDLFIFIINKTEMV